MFMPAIKEVLSRIRVSKRQIVAPKPRGFSHGSSGRYSRGAGLLHHPTIHVAKHGGGELIALRVKSQVERAACGV